MLKTCIPVLKTCIPSHKDLYSCVEDLYSCVEDLYSCVEDLYSCVEDLYSCVEDLYSCVEDLYSCVLLVGPGSHLITAANFCMNGKLAVVGTYDGRCIFYETEVSITSISPVLMLSLGFHLSLLFI